ncbi:MAG TPA: ABC transporter ATP-binding protein [Streptosporangiaceae bacterium]|nr:ABC transporter ATP-binding protein [Streptosporangiaceae bacterium]
MAERIEIANLCKTYPGGAVALSDISLEVPAGQFLVLLGPSGSGKTTLLRCLAGIERISSGRITIGDRTAADGRVHVPPEQRDLSMVFQDYALWPHRTALENVAFALGRRRLPSGLSRQRSMKMLDRMGIGALARRYPNELSGGEQQRVGLARALAGQTGLVLCDEPLSNLDADLRDRLRVEISALVRESAATAVYITHDQAEAFALADTIGVLERGRLVQLGAPEAVYSAPASPFVARFTGLSGEIGVRLTAPARAGLAQVLPMPAAGGQPRPFYARLPQAGQAADEGIVLIRPTGIRICASDNGEHHLTGTVSDVAFRGRGYEHAVDVTGHGRLTGILADTRAARGETVGLVLEPDGCLLYPVPPC